MVVLALAVANDKLRILFFAGACLMAAAVVFVVPPHWRKRLGSPTAVFIAAASALSVFLVNPQAGSSDSKVDTREMANALLVGPFDQRLPGTLTADDPEAYGTRDASAVSNIAVVKIPMEWHAGTKTGKSETTAQVEVYPTPEAAAARGRVQYGIFSGETGRRERGETSPTRASTQTPESWCFYFNDGWKCGGYRGHAYAETYYASGGNVSYPDAQMVQSSLLAYAESKEKLATEPR
ncbi:hypothetical protein [Rhodococcus sp. NCIMB 12038]|uniref:hypothetical protein n=1 Tax=Rhodococcus sp. NCIMB 12038 TaxID=933800 RepID=UPI00211B4F6E|nr:hypothetical protein [Rhodococcus sp. NCIMB 12038]